jgi:hypothetical protein
LARQRPVGDHHVEAMYGEIGEQWRQAAFTTDQPHRFRQSQGRFDEAMGDRLGNRIGDADGEQQALPCRLVARHLEQFIAKGEDLLGVAQNAPAGIGDLQAAAGATEQLDAQRFFEFAQLAADRLRGQVQLLAGASDRARFGDHPEITQVLVVECGHASSIIQKIRNYREIIFDLADSLSMP